MLATILHAFKNTKNDHLAGCASNIKSEVLNLMYGTKGLIMSETEAEFELKKTALLPYISYFKSEEVFKNSIALIERGCVIPRINHPFLKSHFYINNQCEVFNAKLKREIDHQPLRSA